MYRARYSVCRKNHIIQIPSDTYISKLYQICRVKSRTPLPDVTAKSSSQGVSPALRVTLRCHVCSWRTRNGSQEFNFYGNCTTATKQSRWKVGSCSLLKFVITIITCAFFPAIRLLVQFPRGKTTEKLAKSNCPNPPQPSDDLVKEGVGGAGLAEQSQVSIKSWAWGGPENRGCYRDV